MGKEDEHDRIRWVGQFGREGRRNWVSRGKGREGKGREGKGRI